MAVFQVVSVPCATCGEPVRSRAPLGERVESPEGLSTLCPCCLRAAGYLLQHEDCDAVTVSRVDAPGVTSLYLPVPVGGELEEGLSKATPHLHGAVWSSPDTHVLAPEEEDQTDEHDTLLRGSLTLVSSGTKEFAFTRDMLEDPTVRRFIDAATRV